ncbi:MAG: hypothetical protein JW928_00155 [Candidatus Aureabacteria bacterium]|nr:hypothetical protein [Candidatus Auribacterota bacterium]
MNKIVDSLSLFAGIAAFFVIAVIRFTEISMETASDIVIKATLAFLVVSVLSKIILGKIFRKVTEVKRKEMIEKMRIMQKQQEEEQKKP